MGELWSVLFSWLPAWMQVVVLGLIAYVLIMFIIRVIGFVLDAIPFL